MDHRNLLAALHLYLLSVYQDGESRAANFANKKIPGGSFTRRPPQSHDLELLFAFLVRLVL